MSNIRETDSLDQEMHEIHEMQKDANKKFQASMLAHCEAQLRDLVEIRDKLREQRALLWRQAAEFEAKYKTSSLAEGDLTKAILYRDQLRDEIKAFKDLEKYIEGKIPKYEKTADDLKAVKSVSQSELTAKSQKTVELDQNIEKKLSNFAHRKVPELGLQKISVDVIKEKSKSFIDRAKQFVSEKIAYVRENKVKAAIGFGCFVLSAVACVAGLLGVPAAKGIGEKLFEQAKTQFSENSGALIGVAKAHGQSLIQNQLAANELVDAASEGAKKVESVAITPIVTSLTERGKKFEKASESTTDSSARIKPFEP